MTTAGHGSAAIERRDERTTVAVENLTVRYGETAAVRNASLFLERGELVGLVGESGAGKSTLGLALVGLGGAASGSIRIGDTELIGADERTRRRIRRRRVGLAFQSADDALHPAYTLGEQIVESIDGTRRRWRRRHESRVNRLLEDVGLDPAFADRYPHECSGGQNQRALLAVALAGDPDVLVLDEPTSSLDAVTQAHVLETLERVMGERDLAVLLITHDLDVVEHCCDRTVVMREGELVDRGATDRLLSNPTHPYTSTLVDARRSTPRAVDGGTSSAPDADDAVVAELETVTKRYREGSFVAALLGREPTTDALVDASVAVREGECVALVGRSGAGKTTAARLIAGLEAPSAGSVRIRGEPVGPVAERRPAQRAAVGYVFQSPRSSLDPRRTVAESVAEPLEGAGWNPARRDRRVGELLEHVGLEGYGDRYPRELSGGEAQRIAVARALALEPDLLVLDEATSALDTVTTHRLCSLFERLGRRNGRSMLVVTHDFDIARRLADRTLVLADGRVVDEGPTSELLSEPTHAETRTLIDATLGGSSADSRTKTTADTRTHTTHATDESD
ncbi:ABC transporter ATP-binding protein [Natrarchaeobius chitinivorans]|uniref:ABC transporter ATP-binding protein n=1 Tax=Natrarchaeobius chitinivorans TaxID=1679083 RepID=A0A3N6P9W4_NATCH|nr:ABC transporter ATP-binding protein [Natrarchaeobius chitinivorans]RQG95789.1 ABC transporter ATP-binding protein [Natrarchaeobius chitinivorans]